jgi:ABC-type transport system substrate-binding protein
MIELEASPAVAVDRWRRGEYDLLHEMLAFRAVATDEAVVERAPAMSTWYLGFNARRAPLDDPRVRRALAHAIDRQGPAEALRATAAATSGIIPPAMPGHSHRVAPAFDPDRARALLGEAGYADGRALGEIVLAYLDLWEDAASDVAAQLAAIGVRVRLLSTASDSELDAVIEEGAHHCFIWVWGVSYPDPSGVYDPRSPSWPWFYRDEGLEQLLTRAASLRDQDERLRTYREFERVWLGEQAAVVALAYLNRFLWRRPWVTGMWLGAILGADSTFAGAVVRRPDPAPRRG